MITGTDDRLGRVLAVINGKGGAGKCLAASELVYCPQTGQPMTLEEAVRNRLPKVLSYSITGRLVGNYVQGWVDSGVQPVLRIELASGRTITVTKHHPMLAPDGWRKADQLGVGETIAGAARVPGPTSVAIVGDGEVDLLAVMLAEGGTSTAASRFTTTDVGILGLATRGAAALGMTVTAQRGDITYRLGRAPLVQLPPGTCGCGCGRRTRQGPGCHPSSTRPKRRCLPGHTELRYSELTRFRVEHGLDFVLAKHKRMPPIAYQLPDAQLARFVAVFWMCDGYVDPHGGLELVLASESLVREFQHLLLRFGVQSSVAYRKARFDGEVFDAWRLSVYASSLQRFQQRIPLWGGKAERLATWVAHLDVEGSNPNVGSPSLTPELWERIRAYAPHCGRKRPGEPRLRDVTDRLGWTFANKVPLRELLTNKSANGQRYLSQRALRAYIDCFGGRNELGHLTSPDLHWDRITAVVDAGETQVYDLSVPGPANFVANDLVVHNTSIAANTSGQLARAGYRVLAADLDLSGNLKLDLGYVGHAQDDEGKGVLEAIWYDKPLPIIGRVRDNLDVIPGGRHLEMLASLSLTPMAEELEGGGVAQAFAAKLAEVADTYDLVILDCAPGNPVLQDLALLAARYVLIPTKTDAAGWDGLRMVGPRVKKARKYNPALTYLGVVLFAHQTNATRIRKNTQARLDEVSDLVPVLDAYVRHSETAAHDCRMRGQLAHELARDADQHVRNRLSVLRARRSDKATAMPAALSGSADSLAGDYERLTREILLRINAHEQTTSFTKTGR